MPCISHARATAGGLRTTTWTEIPGTLITSHDGITRTDGRTDGQIYPAHYYEPHNGNGYTYIHTNILTYPAPQGQLMRHAFPPRGSDP